MGKNQQPEQSDDQLMASVASGDRSAFRCLAERHHRMMWAVALRFTGNSHDAADLVQGTLLALFQNAATYRPRGRLRSWLLCILVNRAISTRRKQRPVPVDSLEGLPGDPVGETSLARAQTRARISALLAQLPDRQRMVLVLRFYEDLSYDEIAETLSISRKAVERLLHRGRRTLRGQVEAGPPD